MNTILILLFFGIFFALTWRRIESGIFIVGATLPLYVVRFSLFGLPSTLLEGMILLLLCIWLIQQRHEMRNKGQVLLKYKIFVGIVLLFFLASCVSVAIAPHIHPALGLWRAYILEPILFFLVFIDTIHTKRQIVHVCTASIISGCSIALYGILQKITGWGIPQEWIIERRVTSIYPYPNAVGLYLTPIVMLAVALLVWKLSVIPAKAPDLSKNEMIGNKSQSFRAGIQNLYKAVLKKYILTVLISGAIILLLFAIFFAKTESALVALFVSGIVWGLFWSVRSRRATLAFCTAAIFAIIISPPLAKILDEKIFLKDWSGLVRKSIWRETIPMIHNNQILGAGFSGYQEKMKPYHKDTFLEIYQYPHNIVLNFWSEMGMVGLIAFELLVGWYFFILMRVIFILKKIPQGDEKVFLRVLAFGCLLTMSTIMIHGLVDVSYFKNDLSVFFWMLIGIGIAVYTNTKELSVHT